MISAFSFFHILLNMDVIVTLWTLYQDFMLFSLWSTVYRIPKHGSCVCTTSQNVAIGMCTSLFTPMYTFFYLQYVMLSFCLWSPWNQLCVYSAKWCAIHSHNGLIFDILMCLTGASRSQKRTYLSLL